MAGASPQAIDGEKTRRDQILQARAAKRDRESQWAQAEIAHSWVVANKDTSPSNVLRQLGTLKHLDEIEKLVKKLNPNVRIKRTPGKKATVEWIYQASDESSTRPHTICLCEPGVSPEHSIMEELIQEIPFLGSHMTPDTPAFTQVRVPGRELIRGWRTVLLRLVWAGATTPTAVENLVGHSPRAAWQQHLGRAAATLPF